MDNHTTPDRRPSWRDLFYRTCWLCAGKLAAGPACPACGGYREIPTDAHEDITLEGVRL